MATKPAGKAQLQAAVNKHEAKLHKGQPMTKLKSGGVVVRGCGAATKGTKARGPMA